MPMRRGPCCRGARLTAYELAQEGIPHVVQVDGAAASTILRGLVDCAIVGSDRIAANGDVANKIGTVAVALACREAGVPFVVAAPWSTVDLATTSGEDIEIEERSGGRSPRMPECGGGACWKRGLQPSIRRDPRTHGVGDRH